MSDIQEQSYKLKSIIYQQLIYTKIKYTCIVKYYFLNESFAYGGLTVSSLKSDSMNEENIFLAADMCIVT